MSIYVFCNLTDRPTDISHMKILVLIFRNKFLLQINLGKFDSANFLYAIKVKIIRTVCDRQTDQKVDILTYQIVAAMRIVNSVYINLLHYNNGWSLSHINKDCLCKNLLVATILFFYFPPPIFMKNNKNYFFNTM